MTATREHRRDGIPGAALTSWWTNRYTRGLPDEVRERRIVEIEADVHDHRAEAEARGARATRVEIGWRTVRGIPADVSWRRGERRAMANATKDLRESPLRAAWAVLTQTWFAPIAVLVGVFDLLASVAVIVDDDAKMPGQAIGPIVMTLLAVAPFTGLWLRWRIGRAVAARGPEPEPAARDRWGLGLWVGVLVLAFAMLTVGVSTGTATAYFVALGLLVGVAVVAGGRSLVRALRSTDLSDRAGLADGLVVIGTLPALAFFWIFPALLALAVIGGVFGTNARPRPA